METIDVNKKIMNNNEEIEITNEVIVPDIKPDIVNIIDTNGLEYVHKHEIINGSVKLNGTVQTTMIYLSDNGDIRSLQTNLDFEFKKENSEIKEDCILKYDTKIKEISSKMLNERKVSITVKLKISYKIYKKQEVKFFNDFENIEGIQKQEENLVLSSIIGYGTAKTTLDEKINVDSLDVIMDILKVDINIVNIESKMSYNKILAKAEANISIIYLTEDGRLNKVNGNYPVMSFIEIPNVKEEHICELDYKIKNLVFKINNGDEHFINAQIDFEIYSQAFEKKNINIVKDLYSLKSDIEYTKNDIELELAESLDSEIIKIDEKFEATEIKKILDVDIKIDFSNTSPISKIKVYGESNEKNMIIIKEFDVPIISKLESDKDYKLNVKSKEYSLEENNIIVKAQIEAVLENSSFKKISILQDVQVKNTENKEDYSVVVYFVKPNDTIWKIAKKFKVSQESLIRINDLENPDLIYPGDKLYVLK